MSTEQLREANALRVAAEPGAMSGTEESVARLHSAEDAHLPVENEEADLPGDLVNALRQSPARKLLEERSAL